jgi:hypothetical protein
MEQSARRSRAGILTYFLFSNARCSLSKVYDGAAYNCVNFPDHCGSLCTNHGRYCMPDPDKDPYHGYSGRDIVIENLRCVPPPAPFALRCLYGGVYACRLGSFWQVFGSSCEV